MVPTTLHKSISISYNTFFVFLGWFPAKFVEVLDERSKEVTINRNVFACYIYYYILRCLFSHAHLCRCCSVLSGWRWHRNRGSQWLGQRHVVSCSQGHLSARPEEALHTRGTLSPMALHWGGTWQLLWEKCLTVTPFLKCFCSRLCFLYK